MHTNLRLRFPKVGAYFVAIIFALIFNATTSAQSSDVSFPTPVTSDEITGRIAPRDIGDARRTTHFYVFSGKEGDVFVNVESQNLDGDIDLYIADGLRPMTKIVLYGSDDVARAAKSIYLRHEDVLVMRVQARSVGDANGTYRVKFSGAFAPANAALVAKYAKNAPPTVTASTSGGKERVTSTGARIPPPVTIATPTPPRAETVSTVATVKDERATKRAQSKTATANVIPKSNSSPASKANDSDAKTNEIAKTVTPPSVVSNSDVSAAPPKSETKTANVVPKTARAKSAKTDSAPSKPANAKPSVAKTATVKPAPPKDTANATSNATSSATSNVEPSASSSLTNVAAKNEPVSPVKSLDSRTARLVVEMKDGTRIERDMTNVQLMMIEDKRLVVITKDGQTMRQPLANIVRMAIEP